MTQILKEGGKTIIKTGSRIDTMNANQFEADIQSYRHHECKSV